jgi:hypothetical protein
MRSNVVDATPAAAPRRARISASARHDEAKRESSISACVSPVVLKPPNQDSSSGEARAPRGFRPPGTDEPEKMLTNVAAGFADTRRHGLSR